MYSTTNFLVVLTFYALLLVAVHVATKPLLLAKGKHQIGVLSSVQVLLTLRATGDNPAD